jgi:hypothetical protein
MRHSVSNHPEFPQEKGKALHPKNKLIMNTVRDLVLGILQWYSSVDLKKYTQKIDWGNLPKDLGAQKRINLDISDIQKKIRQWKNTVHKKEIVKKWTHEALEKVWINSHNTTKRIHMAIESLGWQYKIMSPERFLHRLDNGKVQRDCRFLIGMIQYMSQLGRIWLMSSVKNLLSDGHYPTLNNSDSMRALNSVISEGSGKNESFKMIL